MGRDAVPEELVNLVRKMHDEYRESEIDIALALAEVDGPLTSAELAENTGYTERTVRKRVGTLEERLHGPPLLHRDEEERPQLHPELASALRAVGTED